MRIKLLSCLLILLVALPVLAAPPRGKSVIGPMSLMVDNTSYIDANRIFMFVTNHGNFGRDLGGYFGYDFGTWFPYTSQDDIANNVNNSGYRSPNYATGIWVGAIDSATGQIRVAVSEYSSEYVPGPMADGTFQDDQPDYKVYKLYRDSLAANPNDDYTNWPVDQGAPIVYDSVLGEYVPEMIGDQMLWAVFNDADPDQHEGVDGGETLPLGIEVKQTVFAFDREGSLGNIVFIRERIYNKGNNTLNECYFSMWCDPDLGGSGDDYVGCDTTLGLGFVYNSSNNDSQYGDGPPAMGIDFFQGPLQFTGDPADTARMWGQLWPEYTNMGMVSFNKYINGTDPDNFGETYGFMRGLTKSGDPYIYNGDTLLYVLSGDPVAGTGDLDIAPADRRWMQTTGPLTFRPGDSTEILVAMIVGQGGSNLSSVTVVKTLDDFAQRVYESGFNPPKAPAKPVVTVGDLSGLITLSWGDTSEVDPGDFAFEGYSVWQGESQAGPWTLLATYDLDNHLTDGLIDTLPDVESQIKIPVIRRVIKNTGLSYHYETEMDAINSVPLRDQTTYFFRVTAFSFGDTTNAGEPVPAGDRFLEAGDGLAITPASPLAGVNPQIDPLDEIPWEHTAGISQGAISPIVMDPSALTGHTYQVTFHLDTVETFHPMEYECDTAWVDSFGPDTCDVAWDPDGDTILVTLCDFSYVDSIVCDTHEAYYDTVNNVYWRLTDATLNTVLLDSQYYQGGEDAYFTVDGFYLEVSGPDPGVLSFECVANANGPIDPPEAAAAPWYDFPVPTDVDPDGYPTDGQQAGDGLWLFHVYDNGGTSCEGSQYSYETWQALSLRNDNADRLGAYDYEMRFTGDNANPGVNGSYVIEWYNDDNAVWVPFELWRTGIGTPDDPSDDVQMFAFMIDDAGHPETWPGDDMYALESWGNCFYWVNPADETDTVWYGGGDLEHSVSGGDNDPFTDWVYWHIPIDETPGSAGYLAAEADMLAGTFDGSLSGGEVMARTVLVNWNGGVLVYEGGDGNPVDTADDGSPLTFTQDCPEQGTILRIVTAKPNAPGDVFTFTAPSPVMTATEGDLDAIKAVPNPFYATGPYDPGTGSYAIKFHRLPAECTISIYTLGGDLVRTIYKNDPAVDYTSWDILTENGLPVASGIYIYVVDAPGFGQKIGKMAVFVEAEVLRIF